MTSNRFAPLALALMLALATSVAAQSLELKKARSAQDKLLVDRAALTNQRCGTDLMAGFDWPTFDEADVLRKRASSWCQAALEAVEDICRTPPGKEALKSLKSITCVGASAPSVALKDGALRFSFSLTPNQNKQLVRTYLEKNL